MFLFGNKKKSTSSNKDNCNEGLIQQERCTKQKIVNIKILGIGCSRCNQLEQATKEALEILKIDAIVEHITDFAEIASYGVMGTPALLLNGDIVSCGRVLNVEEVVKILQKII
jgi:redox-active disulfide protein 2